MTDVTDDTFQALVLDRSTEVAVVVDLWAPWCGPCRTLTPMLEEAIAATNGAVELAKVNVDDNPRAAASFQAQSIPAVYALRDNAIIDGFIGAIPKAQVEKFVDGLLPVPSEADGLTMMGGEESLRDALELEPTHAKAAIALARILIDSDRSEEALALLANLRETPETLALVASAQTA